VDATVTVLVVLEALALLLLGVLVAGLLRSHAEILRALHDLGVGVGDPSSATAGDFVPRPDDAASLHGRAVDVTGTAPTGDALAVAVAGRRQLTLLAFLSSGCLTCRDFWTSFGRRDLDPPGGARVVIITKGPEAESPAVIRTLAPTAVPTVLSSQAWDDYRVPGAPYFVLVDGAAGTVVGEGTSSTWENVRNLLGQAIADAADRSQDDSRDGLSRVDRDLRAAGVGPGHPSLWPPTAPAGEHE
jgi:hypothetical protein